MDKELLPFKERTPENIALAEKATQLIHESSLAEMEESWKKSAVIMKHKDELFAALASVGETL